MDIALQKQRAHDLIDCMSDECFQIIFALIHKIVALESPIVSRQPLSGDCEQAAFPDSEKLQAFHRLEAMRKEIAKYGPFDYETDRAAALEEKYGKCPT